ncbi:MAG: hypothetical protein FD145_1586 [Candidatus Saganbacteria bacterium]|uniref:Clan AA aspartic protease n=1 Tax=Candidatus Saganbacteria bacterium TaxID=2575572 RepID=A0A833KZJ1_UNCSA|nr:MAG: hypothetical protein FD145_1586 [Candidatus Saganbacteria bacterium]
MKGYINSNFEPVIKIGIINDGKLFKFDAIIDTGFNGFISIPHKIIENTSWQFIGYEAYELASGEIIKDKVYLGDIILAGKRKYTYILSNKTDDILAGTKLFADKVLSINFKTKKLEIIEA